MITATTLEPRVSVIVPAFNAQRWITAALQSVAEQTFIDFEVLIVDDGSTDETRKLAEEFAAKDRRFRILVGPNQGSARARMKGVAQSAAEFIAFLDADDFWHSTKLEKQISVFDRSSSDLGLVYCWSRMIDLEGKLHGLFGSTSLATGKRFPQIIYDNFIGNGSVALVRRTAIPGDLDSIALQEGNEDLFLYVLVLERFEVDLVPEFLTAYRWNTGNNQTKNFRRLLSSRVSMLRHVEEQCGRLSEKVKTWSYVECCLAAALVALKKQNLKDFLALLLAALQVGRHSLSSPSWRKLGLVLVRRIRAGSIRRINHRSEFASLLPTESSFARKKSFKGGVVWTHFNGDRHHGGYKATRDVNSSLIRSGWEEFRTGHARQIVRFLNLPIDLLRLAITPSDLIIFVQTPVYGFTNRILLYAILRLKPSFLLVHDVDEVRTVSKGSGVQSINVALQICFSGDLIKLVTCNPPTQGYYRLEAWDYLLSTCFPFLSPRIDGDILFAGSLSPRKAPWLYNKKLNRPSLVIYGIDYKADAGLRRDDYRGPFDADRPEFNGTWSWGLVWGEEDDEQSLKTSVKQYSAFNQPHKLSLYLALGLPVIVRQSSFASTFVKKNDCGICVGSLEDIQDSINKLSSRDFEYKCRAAKSLGSEMRRGGNLLRMISDAKPFT